MRIGLLIGGLGRGGSERQLSLLAAGLAKRGHAVEVVVYGCSGPLEDYLGSHEVPVRVLDSDGKIEKLQAVRRWVQSFNPQVLHGFMKRASCVAILSNLPGGRLKVVASDFSTATYSRRKPILWGALLLYALADKVATQTVANRRSLNLLAPWLRKKTVVVRNGVDTRRFAPPDREGRGGPFRFVCVGTVYRVKNPVRVVEAVSLLRERGARPFSVDWFGRLGLEGDHHPSAEYHRAIEYAQRLGIAKLVTFHGETARVEDAYRGADALLHASLQEGIPNAVVEAMATGLPVVVSTVSDLPLIVSEARNGFVCDEGSAISIADAMQRMLEARETERVEMGARSRELAERWFGSERFITDYEDLYRVLLEGKRS